MRNLKRALSLALASIMVLGMMVVGAGAVSLDDFSDSEKIVNTEAVTTMVSLGVINGKDDGSYDPEGIVTRAEMAKLISVMLNGGKDPTLGSITANFSDTAGHWAENYIAYVANLNIVDGRGDGTFGPNDQVTGAQAAKMLLTALGYRSEIEGFTGANWAVNVQLKGNDIDLFDGLSINPDEGLSRDNTAQMIYNAVQAQEVEYRNLYNNYDNVIYPQDKGTMLYNRFKVSKVEGVVEATSLISITDDRGTTVEGKTRLTDIEYNGERYGTTSGGVFTPGQVTYPVAIDTELLGQRVVIYVKGLNALSPNAAGMEVVGSPILSDDNTVVVTNGRLKDDDAVKDALKGSGLVMATVSGSKSAARLSITEDDTVWGTTNGTQQMPGVKQTFIDNNADGTVDYIIQKNPALTKVNTYNTGKEELNLSGIGTVDFVDVLNPDDVAKDDHVLVYNYDGVYALEKVESVSGPVSAFVNNSSTPTLCKITIDGTNYGWGSGKNLAPDLYDSGDFTAPQLKDLVDGSYTLYLDPHGNMLGFVEDEGAIGNYAVITGINTTGSQGFRSVEVKLIMADGTTGKYDVNLQASANNWNSTTKNAVGNAAKEEAMYNELNAKTAGVYDNIDALVSYSVSNNVVTLSRPEFSTQNYHESTTTADLVLRNSKSRYVFNNGTTGTSDDDTLMADDRTVFFIRDVNNNYTVVTGLKGLRANDLNTLKGAAIYYQTNDTSAKMARAIFAQVDEEYLSNSKYAFITGNYTRTTEGTDTIYSYPVVLEDGTYENATLKTKTQASLKSDEVHEYQLDGNYVTFDNDTSKIYNGLVITGVGSNAIAVADAKNPSTRVDNFPTSGATVWNVEDSDNVFKTDFQKYDKIGLVLDNDGNVETAFVYDRQDGDMATEPGLTVKYDGATQTLTNDQVDVFGVADTKKLTLDVAPANDKQIITVTASASANMTGALGTDMTGKGKEVKTNTSGVVTGSPVDIYTAGAAENGTEITITIKTAQDGYATLTTEYVVTLYSGAGAVNTPTKVELAKPGSTAADLAAAVTLNEGTDTDTATVNTSTGADKLFFKVTGDGSSVVKSMDLEKDGKTVSITKDGIFTAASGKYILTLVMSETGKADATFVYTVTITSTVVKKDAASVVEPTGLQADNTGSATLVVEAETVDQTNELANDSSVAEGAFSGVAASGSDELTYVTVMIPFTGDQYAESIASSHGITIKQVNPSFAGTTWSFASNTKDAFYNASTVSGGTIGGESIIWNNGTDGTEGGYITYSVLVAKSVVTDGNTSNDTITIEVAFGATDTFSNSGATTSITLTIDVSGVKFN